MSAGMIACAGIAYDHQVFVFFSSDEIQTCDDVRCVIRISGCLETKRFMSLPLQWGGILLIMKKTNNAI
jgi:hypothetical protein